MPDTTISFYKIKHFLRIRNLFFLVFKITTIAIFMLLLFFIFFIVILSTKPRKIEPLNEYIIDKLNKIENIDFEYNPETSLLKFNKNLDLEYNINNFSAKNENFDFSVKKIIFNIDFGKLITGKINVKNVDFTDANLKIYTNTNQNINRQQLQLKDTNNLNYKDVFKLIQDKIIASTRYSFTIQQFKLNNFNIQLLNNNTKKLSLRLDNSIFRIDFTNANFRIYQEINFIINDLNNSSKIVLDCDNDKYKICNLKLYNIDINQFKNLFKSGTNLYNYINNIDLIFNLNLNLNMDENFNFVDGNISLFSEAGHFNLKQFFDNKISFKNLNLDFDFKNNFEEFEIKSLTANFNDTDFFMNLFFKDCENYNNVDLIFKVQNLPITNLQKLWPKMLGEEEGIKDWVITHIIKGNIPNAFATMNIKYFKDSKNKKDSGLQTIYSEIKMKDILLNYDNYFPEISNINGTAIFTENNMNINIDSAKVLSSKINNSNVFIDFNKNDEEVDITANVQGPFADLLVHIDKDDKKIIETSANNIIQDYYTKSNLKIEVPLVDDLDFNKVAIDIYSNILNKPNTFFKNTANIFSSFTKKQNSNDFYGNIDFTNSELVFLPLNMIKEAGKNLKINYSATLENEEIVKNIAFTSLNNYITFKTSGYIDFTKKEQDITIYDIKYNDSNYNIFYNSYVANDKIFNNIIINGKNINYSNIVERLSNINTKNIKKDKKVTTNNIKTEVETETTIKANLEYLNFANKNKIYNPTLMIILKNNNLNILELYAKMNSKNYIKVAFDQNKNDYKIVSNNFGELLSITGTTNSLKNGNGYIEFSLDKNNNIKGSIQLENGFRILPDDNVKSDVLTDVNEDKNFKNLQKKLKKGKGIDFDKLVGEFSYSDNILTLKELVASSKYIGFQILASGTVNISESKIDINGLFVPLGIINGLFGMNKLPLISDIIFGQKNAGLFASKFEITKNKDEKMNIKINKFSTILPGFLRNILTD